MLKALPNKINSTGLDNLRDLKNPIKDKVKGLGPSFEEFLNDRLQAPGTDKVQGENASVKFSAHAIDRIRSRNISMGVDKLERVNQAVAKAALKGSKNTLVLLDDSALVVNVKKQTVITAMDKNMMKENVFTNIDSTVIA